MGMKLFLKHRWQQLRCDAMNHKKHRWFAKFLLGIGLVWVGSHWIGLGVNVTHSLPYTLFWVDKTVTKLDAFKKGDFVVFAWNGNDHYYPKGVTFLKKVAGISPDLITQTPNFFNTVESKQTVSRRWGTNFFINGQFVGLAKGQSLTGEVLKPNPLNQFVIPKNQFWAQGTHADSLDSRYEGCGLIHEHQIRGKAHVIF